jgi:hypothetical protein
MFAGSQLTDQSSGLKLGQVPVVHEQFGHSLRCGSATRFDQLLPQSVHDVLIEQSSLLEQVDELFGKKRVIHGKSTEAFRVAGWSGRAFAPIG